MIYFRSIGRYHPPMPYDIYDMHVDSEGRLRFDSHEIESCRTFPVWSNYIDSVEAVFLPQGNLCKEVVTSFVVCQGACLFVDHIGEAICIKS